MRERFHLFLKYPPRGGLSQAKARNPVLHLGVPEITVICQDAGAASEALELGPELALMWIDDHHKLWLNLLCHNSQTRPNLNSPPHKLSSTWTLKLSFSK